MIEQRLILDRYRLIGKAGAGGYATVQHAFDTRLKRDVAIKCIPLSHTEVLRVESSAAKKRAQSEAYDEKYGYDGYEDEQEEYVLPSEPSFLNKRDEHAKKRAERNKARRGKTTRFQTSRFSRVSPVRPIRNAKGSYATNTADIAKLAGELPGVISGAGHTKIASIDDAVDIDADLIEGANGQVTAAKAAAGHTLAFTPRSASDRTVAAAGARTPASAPDEPQRRRAPRIKDPDFIQKHAQAAIRAESIGSDAHLSGIDADEETDNIPGLDEARTAAHLNDANIVTVYDCVVDGQMAYVIMEYVEGKTLARVMRELDNDITLDMVTSVFQSVSHALEVAHKAGVLHLDIKPENVVINRDGIVKVTDFGLSTLMDASGQGTTGGGTIGYMPLEQMRQEPLDVRTDEWALASLTYEMLSGVNPFRARTLDGAEAAILNAELVLPSLCWDIDESVDDIMFIALEPDLDQRYPTVTDFAEDLAPFLGNAKDGTKQLADVVAASPALDARETDALATRYDSAPSAPTKREGREARESRSGSVASRGPKVPIIDRIGDRGVDIIMRIISALSACMITVISLMNFRFGFASSAPFGASIGNAGGSNAGASTGAPTNAATNVASGNGPSLPDLSGISTNEEIANIIGGEAGHFAQLSQADQVQVLQFLQAQEHVDISNADSVTDALSLLSGQSVNLSSIRDALENLTNNGFDLSNLSDQAVSAATNAAANAATSAAQGASDAFTSSYSTTYGDDSLFGLFSMAPIVAWVILAVFTVCAFLRPRWAMPVIYVGFFVTLLFNQAWIPAFLLLLITGAWWWFFGRKSNDDCAVVMVQPLFGSLGFAGLAPVLAGVALDVKEAIGACIMAGGAAIVFASLGSASLMNWEIYANFIVAVNPSIAGASITDGFMRTVTSPVTWCVFASWIAGGVLYSLFCWKGTRTFDILGSLVCAAFLVAGVLFVPLVLGAPEPLSAMQIAGAVVPALVGVLLALANVPDRIRIDYSSSED